MGVHDSFYKVTILPQLSMSGNIVSVIIYIQLPKVLSPWNQLTSIKKEEFSAAIDPDC